MLYIKMRRVLRANPQRSAQYYIKNKGCGDDIPAGVQGQRPCAYTRACGKKYFHDTKHGRRRVLRLFGAVVDEIFLQIRLHFGRWLCYCPLIGRKE